MNSFSYFHLFVVAIVLIVILNQVRLHVSYRRKNFDWYRSQYPNLVRNGRVHCHHCDANDIRVRGLMRQTFTREHLCGRCGTTLYYSKEASA